MALTEICWKQTNIIVFFFFGKFLRIKNGKNLHYNTQKYIYIFFFCSLINCKMIKIIIIFDQRYTKLYLSRLCTAIHNCTVQFKKFCAVINTHSHIHAHVHV